MTNLVESFADLQAVTARDLMGADHGTIHAGACVADVEERLPTGRARHLIVIGDERFRPPLTRPRKSEEAV